MNLIAISENVVVATKGLYIDYYDNTNHTIVDVALKTKTCENDYISDIIISQRSDYLAILTSTSKQLFVFDLPLNEKYCCFTLPRSASKIRFAANNTQLLVADKTGDVLIYDINKPDDGGTKLLGHLSLLLDVLQTPDNQFIITCDRDEKIRVTCYPNTYNIQTYCLGHKEFVNHIELLPHSDKHLTSTSGDCTVKIWDYVNGTMCYSIDVNLDVNDCQLVENFIKMMDIDAVEVNTLPIDHYAVTKLNDNCSILAVSVHSTGMLFIYSLQTNDNVFCHRLEDKLTLEQYPISIKFHKLYMYIYDSINNFIKVYKVMYKNNKITLENDQVVKMFKNVEFPDYKVNSYDNVKVLYKRKFDNVQEYQERKKQRLDKLSLK